jgi:YHS domain-containing protein
MNGRVYCTYFDHNYLSRGLALYYSLQRHAPGARLWVLCLSERCFNILQKSALPFLLPVRLSEFEASDPETAATKASRKPVEYYFTLTPGWMLYVAELETAAEWITYLDGDLYFFASPDPIYGELSNAAAAIIPHRFAPNLRKLRRYGTYNVGWVGAHNDERGIAILKWWRERCVEWCFDYVDGDRFADQGYLDRFPAMFGDVAIIGNVGANLAPWNVGAYTFDFRDGQVLIDGAIPLIFFHFQGLRKAWGCFVFNSHRVHRAPFTALIRDHVYRPYIDELVAIEATADLAEAVSVRPHDRLTAPNVRVSMRNAARNFVEGGLRLLDIVTRRAFVILRGRAY